MKFASVRNRGLVSAFYQGPWELLVLKLAAGYPHFLVSRAGFHFRIKEQYDFKVGGDYGTLAISSCIVLGVLMSN